MLVFCDDILIYSPIVSSHTFHLATVLRITNQLVANVKKCHFSEVRIEYLGHLVSSKRVAVDSFKL